MARSRPPDEPLEPADDAAAGLHVVLRNLSGGPVALYRLDRLRAIAKGVPGCDAGQATGR